ncbi:RelA/SpoT family protein [Prevotella sp. E13-27]|uniref:RelA/SpoT family protein n=1 Tax=Prevotella sp. E13-27 TaxID=2938122 RepID=UPI00200AB3C3|nr:RelA/SpoT family protein [Prevotella sp. E13-27]MCK8623408.1 RelA/SpoT family protein [Prevotella sp. E13-27]
MTDRLHFTSEEREAALKLYNEVKELTSSSLSAEEEALLRSHIMTVIEQGQVQRDVFGLNPILLALQTTKIVVEEIGLRRDAVLAVMLRPSMEQSVISLDEVQEKYGESVARILHGLERIQELYKKNPVIESENFRNLLLSFAEDMRVILIMIADRVNLMRQIRDTDNDEAKMQVSQEAAYLYAPLAHKLGLYKLKSELEDLSLKYMEHDAYYHIKEKLNATKEAREAYIADFITPIEQKLKAAGLKFHMKGRTKSIHSIWQKMKKQHCAFEGVYDLFAIRIIIDCPLEKEKQSCWQTFAIITDMYTSNPKRMRDWLSVPKSNGYESLHITVLGPQQKWVEVQIRTERMDEIAERGVAAHWRYKGVKAEGGMDEWLTGIRQMLENANEGMEAMDQFKMELQDEEVYVFTPRGDLLKFPTGATVLDMAYYIHSKVGSACTGARINNKVVTFRQELHSGDQVEILTSSQQKPKQEWLNIVKTSRAKAKIKLALKETQQKEALMVKEMLERKFKNRKIEQDESLMMRTMKKLGYKEASDFYRDIASETLDVGVIIDKYLELQQGEKVVTGDNQARSADEFVFDERVAPTTTQNEDVLVIDQNLKGVDYHLAHCCNPIYGDDVFGFVTAGGGIKIHRCDCPNAPEMKRRFGYRIVKAKWSGKGGSQYSITLRVIGNDDLGIVNNLTSIISKDEKLVLRSINIDSNDGLFRGNLVIMINDNTRLETLIKKLRTVKGVKQVERI